MDAAFPHGEVAGNGVVASPAQPSSSNDPPDVGGGARNFWELVTSLPGSTRERQ
jgi:hypothetical protein